MRKSIVIFGIIMAFILGSLVSAPSVAAPTGGAALLAEQVAEIEDIIRGLQDELNNIHVPWGNVTHTPPGFAKDTNTGGIFQGNTSSTVEPCNAGDTVTWDGAQWVCSIPLSGLNCDPNQIVKWDGTQWFCADETTGLSGSTEVIIEITGPSDVIEIFPDINVIKNFKITGLPSSTIKYKIPINLIQLGANMGAISGSFEILLEESSDGVTFSQFFFIGVADSAPIFRSTDHIQANKEHIEIEAGDTEKFFRLIGRTFGASPTGSFDNLKLIMELALPAGATIQVP